GKLDEFNRLLRGATDTSYAVRTGDPAALEARYVLTLDADTVLPRDAARRLVATLAHPLNRPVPSADGRRVAAGYGARHPRVTDVEVFDDFPAKYHAYARREHRWVRGDWQLLPWLGRTVPTPDGRQRNILTALGRWKVLDNLRRSLVPGALVVLLALGWTVLP